MAWLIVGLGMVFAFLNGVHDSGSLTAAMIGSGAVGPRKALLLTAAAQLAGALLVGVAVARTVGQDIIVADSLAPAVVVAALAGGIIWNLLTWYLGLPSSTSHALIGALVGAVVIRSGMGAVSWPGLAVILLVLFLSPWVGFLASFLVMRLLLAALQDATPRVGGRLRAGQWLLTPLVAVGHGANDAQKVMGIVALGLVSARALPAFAIPPWLQLAAAVSLALGTSVGGLRILRTLGLRLYRIRPVHGFAAELASAVVVLGASFLGGPVSTTQVISASIAGAGSAHRLSQVRWSLIGNVVAAWALTIPAAGGLGGLLCWAIQRYL